MSDAFLFVNKIKGKLVKWLCELQVVSRDIRRILTQRASHFNLVLDDVSITNLTFSREYTHAVEAKQVSQQEAERAKFIVSLLFPATAVNSLNDFLSFVLLQQEQAGLQAHL